MNKKVIAFVILVILSICMTGLIACGSGSTDNDSFNGIYYYCESGSIDKNSWIKLDGDTWSDDDNASGRLSISGTTVKMYGEVMGEEEELFSGELKDGVLTINALGAKMTYYKDGKISDNTNNETDENQEMFAVTYNANGGKFANDSETFIQDNINKGALLTAPTSPTRENYTFAGWSKDSKGNEMWQFSNDKVNKDVTLYAVWTQKSASILSIDGASINGAEIVMIVEENVSSVSLASKVVCSADSFWKLYYDALGQTEIPTKIAASQSGSLLGGDNLFYIVVTSSDQTQVNVYELRIHRKHQIQIGYFNGATLLKTVTAQSSQEFNASYQPTIKGYTFNGWKTQSGAVYTKEVAWSSFALYADTTANNYTVTYDVNGGAQLTNTTKTLTYDASFKLSVPTRVGYTFNGWYYGNTQISDDKGEGLSAWNYDKNITLKAQWTPNTYTVTLKASDSVAGSVSGAGEYAYDSQVTITANTKNGYTFVGWFDSENQLVSSSLSYGFKMGFNVTYTAKWTYYTFNTAKNISSAGTISYYNDKITVGNSITITAETNMGYNWLGWYNGDEKLTDELNYTFNMLADNIAYTAKWVLKDEMGNFKFTSTKRSCTIGGIKDALVTEIIVPNYVTSIERGAFSSCNNLQSITLPFVGGSTSSNTYLGYIFGAGHYGYNSDYVPASLKTVELTDDTRIADCTFIYCDNLQNIIIPEGVLSIGSSAFEKCSGLLSITIPDSVTSISSSAFYKCTALQSITIGNGLTSISGEEFIDCSSLESIVVKSDNTKYYSEDNCLIENESKTLILGCKNSVIPNDGSVTSIGKYAFRNCTGLQSITIPDTMIAIPGLAFYGCTGLQNIIIPNTVTAIGISSFYNCSNLKNITIPNSVTMIVENAFRNCTALQKINYNGTMAQWNSITKGKNWNSGTGNYIIHCTDGDLNKS